MAVYHHPIKNGNVTTSVMVSSYDISQKTKFANNSCNEESQMSIELIFLSNDFSPAKYEEFLIKFQIFLNENYGLPSC